MMLKRISAARVSAIATAIRSILMRLDADSGLAILISLPVDCVVRGVCAAKRKTAHLALAVCAGSDVLSKR